MTDWRLVPAFQGGAAEFVAQQLDVRMREHLRLRNNLLTEGTPGLSASLSRPLLCLFDRNFELSVVRARIPCFRSMLQPICLCSAVRLIRVPDRLWSKARQWSIACAHRNAGYVAFAAALGRGTGAEKAGAGGMYAQVLQHAWTYKPLVQDVLGLSLNRVTIDAEPSPGQQLLQPNAPSTKIFEACIHPLMLRLLSHFHVLSLPPGCQSSADAVFNTFI